MEAAEAKATAKAEKAKKKALDKEARVSALLKGFSEFDLDQSGMIESLELLELGKARRSLGQKENSWTEDKNTRLVRRMDENHDGVISASEFSDCFEQALPMDMKEFDAVIVQFMAVARACRKRKQSQKRSMSPAQKKTSDSPSMPTNETKARKEKARKKKIEMDKTAADKKIAENSESEDAAAKHAAKEAAEAKAIAKAEAKAVKEATMKKKAADEQAAEMETAEAKATAKAEKAKKKALDKK